MKLLRVALVILILALSGAIIYPRFFASPCDQPLAYAIGRVDSRFGITNSELKNKLLGAENLWETALGKDLFVYEDNAEFKVNMIFDERQQRTLDEKNFRENIDLANSSYEALVNEYKILNADYEQRLREYEEEVKNLILIN